MYTLIKKSIQPGSYIRFHDMTIIILSIQLWLEEISIIKNFEIFNKIICRTLLNCTAMDIMYYTSPLFRMEIWSALQFELNRLYQMFTQRNPTFEANGGKVSIVSHSLGNSISFHIGIRIFHLLIFSLTICLLVIMSAFHSENPYVNSGLFYWQPALSWLLEVFVERSQHLS